MIEMQYPHGEDFPIVKVSTKFCEAEVSLYGGHLMSWIPTGQKPVFFMSEKTVFKKGTALRGGVPICWPWFGKHPSDPAQPSHGLARIEMWKLDDSTEEEEEVRLSLSFEAPELQLQATYGLLMQKDSLYATLITQYTGFEPIPYSAALHSYFAVSSNEHVAITGLEEAPFTEFASEPPAHSEDPLVPAGSINRIYHPVQTDQIITLHDPGWNRSLEIVRQGSSRRGRGSEHGGSWRRASSCLCGSGTDGCAGGGAHVATCRRACACNGREGGFGMIKRCHAD